MNNNGGLWQKMHVFRINLLLFFMGFVDSYKKYISLITAIIILYSQIYPRVSLGGNMPVMAAPVTTNWGCDDQIILSIVYASFHSSFLGVVIGFALYLTTGYLQRNSFPW